MHRDTGSNRKQGHSAEARTGAADHSHDHSHEHDSHSGEQGHSHSHGHDEADPHSHGSALGARSNSHNHGHSHGHHHHGHDHGHHDHGRSGNKRGLAIALAITSGVLLLEFVGGLLTNSLALLSDSGHMLSDAASLLLSLIAIRLAIRPATARKTYGYYRFEILAALLNGVTLFIVAGVIIVEAVRRIQSPPEVASGAMMAIAAVGLAANLLSALALMRSGDVHGNLNMRSAYLHVLGDALGSVGALAAGAVMLAFKWYWADPVISVLVAVLILRGAWGVTSRSLHVLMEGAPPEADLEAIQQQLAQIPGVENVHDLHVWTITSGMTAMSGHLRIDGTADGQKVLQAALDMLKESFGITHATIQVESADIRHEQLHD